MVMSESQLILERLRMHWSVLRGAQFDILKGRPHMDALEEIALASNAIDELLNAGRGTDDGPVF